MKKLVFLFTFLIFLFPLVAGAPIGVSGEETNNVININPVPDPAFNNNTQDVNNSQFLRGFIPTDFLFSTGDTGTGNYNFTQNVSIGSKLILPFENDATSPTLQFGDGDTGLFQQTGGHLTIQSDANIAINNGGTARFQFASGTLSGVNGDAGAIMNENSGTLNPTLVPDRTDTNTGVGGGGSDALYLITGAKTGLTVDSTQEIGIGTTVPDARLEVFQGTGSKWAGLFKADPNTALGLKIQAGDDNSNDILFQISDFLDTTDHLTVTGDGLVGIGTSAPTHTLEVVGDTNITNNLTVDGDVLFIDSGQDRIGIGTRSPLYTIHMTSPPSNTILVGLRPSSISSGDTILYQLLPTVEGNVKVFQFTGIASNEVFGEIINNNDTSSTADALLNLQAKGNSGGDPFIKYTVAGVLNWAIGVDNSDDDKFKISADDDLGTNDRLVINDTTLGIGTGNLVGTLSLGVLDTSDQPAITLRNSANTFGFDIDVEQDAVGRLDLYRVVSSVRSQVLSVLRSNGNVGIGTTSPTHTLNVVGDINYTNNLTEGSFYYANIFQHDKQTVVTIDTQDVDANITNFTQGFLNGFSMNDDTGIIADVSGLFKIDWSISFSDGGNVNFEGGIALNSVMQNQTTSHRKTGNAADEGNFGGTGIIQINLGDTITLMIRNEDSTSDVTVGHSNVALSWVGN